MVPDAEGIDRGARLLDVLAQEAVEAVFVNAGSVRGAVEAAQTAPGKGKVPEVDEPDGIGRHFHKAPDHGVQGLISLFQIRHERDRPLRGRLPPVFRDRRFRQRPGPARRGGNVLRKPVFRRPEHMPEEIEGFLPPFLLQQIFHIRREASQAGQMQIGAVFADELVRRGVVKMLGCRNLRREFSRQVRPAFLHQLEKAVKLGGDEKGVNRIAEDDQLRLFQHLPGR